MVNKIIDAISMTISTFFGDEYEIYTESIKQGFKEPCFFIYNFNSTNNVFLGKRYFNENQFCINFFPSKGKENEKCHEVGSNLYECLRLLNVGSDLVKGIGMKYDILDSVLNFYVNYNLFEYKPEDVPPMENISYNLKIRE